MIDRTIPFGAWREYPGGLKVFYLHRKPQGVRMAEVADLRLLYLTLPTPSEPTLNLLLNDQLRPAQGHA